MKESSLKTHIEVYHTKVPTEESDSSERETSRLSRVSCQICSKHFITNKNLNTHTSKYHKNVSPEKNKEPIDGEVEIETRDTDRDIEDRSINNEIREPVTKNKVNDKVFQLTPPGPVKRTLKYLNSVVHL